jgi:hypothetical protein
VIHPLVADRRSESFWRAFACDLVTAREQEFFCGNATPAARRGAPATERARIRANVAFEEFLA